MPTDSGPPAVWTRVCAWCGITLPGGDLTPEPTGGSPLVTHGICPGCKDRFIRAVAAEREAIRSARTAASGAC